MGAAAAATSSALDLFLYKWQVKVTGTDADGEDEDQVIAFSSEYTMMTAEEVTTPYWRYASLIMDWTCFTVMSTLTVTQLLSMLGIAASTNLMAWHYGGMVAGLMTLVAYIMSFLATKQAGMWQRKTLKTMSLTEMERLALPMLKT